MDRTSHPGASQAVRSHKGARGGVTGLEASAGPRQASGSVTPHPERLSAAPCSPSPAILYPATPATCKPWGPIASDHIQLAQWVLWVLGAEVWSWEPGAEGPSHCLAQGWLGPGCEPRVWEPEYHTTHDYSHFQNGALTCVMSCCTSQAIGSSEKDLAPALQVWRTGTLGRNSGSSPSSPSTVSAIAVCLWAQPVPVQRGPCCFLSLGFLQGNQAWKGCQLPRTPSVSLLLSSHCSPHCPCS